MLHNTSINIYAIDIMKQLKTMENKKITKMSKFKIRISSSNFKLISNNGIMI